MEVFYLDEITEFIGNLEYKDRSRLDRTIIFFERSGFQIGPKYIKKITTDIWELRAGSIRLFLYIKRNAAYGVNIIRKKSQKLPRREIYLAVKRSQQL